MTNTTKKVQNKEMNEQDDSTFEHRIEQSMKQAVNLLKPHILRTLRTVYNKEVAYNKQKHKDKSQNR